MIAERQARIEHAYNRHFKGYVAPTYDAEPLSIARWVKDGVRLHPHQVAGARRVLANRGGLLAFDVGVGKTYTGIAVLAQARQDGWCRRPVVLVPNSIVWKWEADIRRVLEMAGGNVTDAARSLGIARSTLYENIRRHGLG